MPTRDCVEKPPDRWSRTHPRHSHHAEPVQSHPEAVFKGCAKDAQGMHTL
jgi:hypothetical protein